MGVIRRAVRTLGFSGVLGLVAVLGVGVALAASAHHPSTHVPPHGLSAAARHRLASAYGRLPLSFEQNRGQADRRVRFLVHGSGYTLGLTDHGALLALTRKSSPASGARTAAAGLRGHPAAPHASVRTLSVGFLGASRGVRLTAGQRLAGRVNYMIGNDRRRWHTNIPTFSGAAYHGVWSGIDATFTGSQRQLEYVFTVAPGADPRQIRLGYHGQSGLRLDRSGNLIVTAGAEGTVRQLAPHAYQIANGRKLTDKAIRRGVFHSVPDLITAIETYLNATNESPTPFVWTATTDQILEKVRRGRVALNQPANQN